jgi:hypothetical protein
MKDKNKKFLGVCIKMKLNELLGITAMNTVINLKGINSNRKERNIAELNAKNNMEIILTYAWDDIIKEYGENKVLNQSLNDGKLEVLIKE